jgi:hypothetical protein
MNNNFLSTRAVRLTSAIAAVIALFLFNPLNSAANNTIKDKKNPHFSDEQVSVQYTGANESNVIFRVQLENPGAQKFWLIVKNDAGEIVYQQQFTDAHFAKSVYLPKEEYDIHPTFVIRSGSEEVVRSFSVNRTVTENVTVTKL